jgi:hypothetical protein
MCALVKALSLSLFVCGALLLLIANGALGDGIYQRTRDGKTLVWNNSPRPEDAVKWSGDRDADGYAIGYGTLTWYTITRVIVTGSILPTPKYVAATHYSGNMVRGKLDGSVVNVDANGKKFHGTFADGRKASDWIAGSAPSSNQPRNERPRRAELVEAPAEGPSPAKAPVTVSNQKAEHVASPREAPSGAMDDSLRELVGPPSLLRTNTAAEASPQVSVPSTASSSPALARLTTPEAIELADAEARAQGYQLGTYQHPQARYTAADDTWSVFYEQKSANGAGENAKRFTVSVQDKSKKTSVVPPK